MQADYDPETGYHAGPPAIQDALAHLGVFKRIEEVPARYRLQNYTESLNASDLWEAFVKEHGDSWGDHTRRNVYGKAWREWMNFCDERGVHSALPNPADVEEHIAIQREEVNTGQTVYTNRYRPLYRFFTWLTFHPEWPHKYNPALMAVVHNGAVAHVWQWRMNDRKYDKYNNDTHDD